MSDTDLRNGPSCAELQKDPDDLPPDGDYHRLMWVATGESKALGKDIDPERIHGLPGDPCERMRVIGATMEFQPGEFEGGISAQSVLGVPADQVERIDLCVGLRGDRAIVDRLTPPELVATTKGPGESLGTAHAARIHQVVAENAAEVMEGLKSSDTSAVTPADIQDACNAEIAELQALLDETIQAELQLIQNDLNRARPGSPKAFDLVHQKARLTAAIEIRRTGSDVASMSGEE